MNRFEVTPQPPEAIDAKLYDDYSSIKQLSAYNYLGGEREYRLDTDTLQDAKILKAGVRENIKHSFLSGEVRNPELTYPKLEQFDSVTIEKQFLSLKEKIKKEEKNETVKKLYIWKINEKIAENRMLQAAQNGDDRRFTRYSTFINGKPEKKIFDYTIATLLVETQKALNDNTNIVAKNAAQRLRKEFSSILTRENDFTLQQHNTEELKDIGIPILSLEHKDDYFHTTAKESGKDNDVEEKNYTDTEIVTEFTIALQEYELEGWEVIIDDTKTAISIGKKKIIIPKDRQLKESELRGLIAHEIGVHARRSDNGERTKLKLLRFGLDRSKDDEGIAMYEQQKITGMKDFAGFAGYLAISLAMGVDGKKRDFRDVFDILTNYQLMHGKDYEAAQNIAWNQCVRTFRGTTGATPGACFTKDLFYRENNIGVWNLVKKDSPEVRRFMIGRYDPINERHIWILDQLNITEEDLDQLKNSKIIL